MTSVNKKTIHQTKEKIMKTQHLFLLFLITCYIILSCDQNQSDISTDLVIPVSVEQVTKKSIQEFVSTTGTLNAINDATLLTESEGDYYLRKNPGTGHYYQMGDKVKKGEILIILKNEELENNIKIESQKLNLDITKREYEKQKSLYDKGGVTLRELKNAEKSYIDAKYTYEYSMIQLNKLTIKSPFNGIIVDLPYHTEGTKVTQNFEAARIMNYDELIAEIKLPVTYLNSIKSGNNALAMNYSQPDDTLRGEITDVSPMIESNSRTFKLNVVIDNPEQILRPGMFVEINVILAEHTDTIVIPKEIITVRRGQKRVYVVEKGTAVERVVTTGLENVTQVEILEGLKENERIVVKGFETLRNRVKVKIVN